MKKIPALLGLLVQTSALLVLPVAVDAADFESVSITDSATPPAPMITLEYLPASLGGGGRSSHVYAGKRKYALAVVSEPGQ